MIKFNKYSALKYNFDNNIGLLPSKYAYGPTRVLKRRSDGKLFIFPKRSYDEKAIERDIFEYRSTATPKDIWNLVFFKTLEDREKFYSITEFIDPKEINKEEVELIDPVCLRIIYDPV